MRGERETRGERGTSEGRGKLEKGRLERGEGNLRGERET